MRQTMPAAATTGACRLVSLSPVSGLAAAATFPAGRTPPTGRCRPTRSPNFDALYATNCAGCHGADGKLGPAPPLNDPLFLAIVPEAELLRIISEGESSAGTEKRRCPPSPWTRAAR